MPLLTVRLSVLIDDVDTALDWIEDQIIADAQANRGK